MPVWHSGLTVKQSADIERVQRVAISIVLGLVEFDYESACAYLDLKPLHTRRHELCEKFALKTASIKCRHTDLFKVQKSCYNTRLENYYTEHLTHTARFYKSPLPFLT